MQRWLIAEATARNVKLVFTSNQPWSVLPLISQLGGKAVEVTRDPANDRRSYRIVENGTVSYTPQQASEGALRALRGVLPEAVVSRAAQLVPAFLAPPLREL